jgi:mannose-6-phosphate isomerase-like protein (cupin superfamily)
MVEVVDLARKFAGFSDTWSPKVVADLNDAQVKVVKLKGEFVWHQHEGEDEMFLVVKGKLTIKLRDRDLHLAPGQLVVIPRGVEHCPVADETCEVVLVEPRSTLNTGNVREARTVERPQRL